MFIYVSWITTVFMVACMEGEEIRGSTSNIGFKVFRFFAAVIALTLMSGFLFHKMYTVPGEVVISTIQASTIAIFAISLGFIFPTDKKKADISEKPKVKNNFIFKWSNETALLGAEKSIDRVNKFITRFPKDKYKVCEMALLLFDNSLGILGIKINNNISSSEYYTPEYRYLAHNIKKERDRKYQKGTPEWAAASLAMAGFSILGAHPSHPNREVQWNYFLKVCGI